jgi:hypothetical protein
MKTTIVLALLLAATPAFAQSSGGPGAPGATMHDYKLAPHQRRPLHMAAPTRYHHPATRVRPHPLHHMQPANQGY